MVDSIRSLEMNNFVLSSDLRDKCQALSSLEKQMAQPGTDIDGRGMAASVISGVVARDSPAIAPHKVVTNNVGEIQENSSSLPSV